MTREVQRRRPLRMAIPALWIAQLLGLPSPTGCPSSGRMLAPAKDIPVVTPHQVPVDAPRRAEITELL